MAGDGIERLAPDKRNANRGTVRGRALLEDSLRRYGAGRSILADKHGNIIAGNKQTIIYALCDPDTIEVRYVGKTTNLKRRIYEHLHRKDCAHTPVRRWVAKLQRGGKQPVVCVIEVCGDDWAARERHWIAAYRADGGRMLNLSDGGDGAGGIVLTPERRAHLSAVAKAQGRRPPRPAVIPPHPQSAETRAKISRARQGMRFTPEHRLALSAKKQAVYAASTRVQDSLSRRYAVLADEQVVEVWRLAWAGEISQREIALRFGIPQSSVSEIKYGKRYKHVERPQR
jgi:hypothetical protein